MVTVIESVVILFIFMLLLVAPEIIRYNRNRKEERNKLDKERAKLQNEIKRISGIIRREVNKGEILGGDSVMELKNTNSLEQLLEVRAKEEDYDLALEMLIGEVKRKYEEFQFKFLKPQPGDFFSGYAVTFEILPGKDSEFLHNLFKLVIGKNLSEGKLADLFVEEVKKGNVIDLGDVILDDTGTGMSSLLTGEPVTVAISFETEEYKEKRLEREEEQKKEEEEQKAKQAKFEELRMESHKALTEASVILKEMSAEIVKEHPEYLEAYERMRELYK